MAMVAKSTSKSRSKAKATASDTAPKTRAYLAALSPVARKAVKQIREAARSIAPDAVEHFSYGIPGFRFAGRPLVWYGGWSEHVSIYPFSEAFARGHGIVLKGYRTSKGTIRFPLSK